MLQTAWRRRQGVRSEDDHLVAGGPGEFYRPFDWPNLPNRFAKVVDPVSAVAFAEEFGLLGYLQLWNQRKDWKPGKIYEPIPWVLAHSRAVAFAIRLVAVLCKGEGAAERLLEANRFKGGGWAFVMPEGLRADVPSLRLLGQAAPDDRPASYLASNLVVDLVNKNTKGVRHILQNVEPYGLQDALTAPALVEVIWWHVGQWALQVVKGGEVRLCEYCGTPFQVTDGRQRFCPKTIGEESLCALKARQKRFQRRQGGVGAGGKTEAE